MAGFMTTNTSFLTRSDVWSTQLLQNFEEYLFTTRYLKMLENFPDGDTFHLPVIGDLLADNYVEGQAVKYSAMDTGEFVFQITEYLQSGTYITNKQKQDMYYMNELVSTFVPKQHRAIMERMEGDFLRVGPLSQTQGGANEINGVAHRWVGTGTGDTIAAEDFARARIALQKANVPMTNLVAIVDPSVEFTFNTLANFTNLAFNPKWEGIVADSISTGLQFKVNIYGFDVYVSNFLHQNTAAETIYAHAAPTSAVNNIMFSATPEAMPIVGAIRQPPKVDSKYNQDLQREEYVTTTRYGMALQRAENFVSVLTAPSVAAPSYA